MIYLLIGIVIGLIIYHLLLQKEIRNLTRQLTQLRIHKLHRTLSSEGSPKLLDPLLTELNALIATQQDAISQLQKHKVHLKADLMNISHDLRTPLTAIYGYLQLLNDEQLTVQERTHYLEIATQRTEVLEKLIQDVFYLGKLEANTIEHERTPLRLDMILKEQLISLYQVFEEANMNVIPVIAEHTVQVSDEAAVKRIFNNLLLNAVQHGAHTLTITHDWDADQRCYTRFNNPLDQNVTPDINRVFNRHYTGAPHRNQSNSGLGLAICAELCAQLEHDIEAYIEERQFIVEIYW
ncbi:HAMP domain-containing histidine kinase [Aerococcaceae bacterium NML191219]|nr:HAMP domain-containing histidine kinase [Aerococcaceae bacterium NML191219]